MQENVIAFLNHLSVERGASPNTIAAYRNDLEQLVEHATGPHQDGRRIAAWSQVDQPFLSDYVVTLYGRGYSATTVARKIASVKSFFSYLVDEGEVVRDPTERLSTPRVGRSLPKALSVEEAAFLQHLQCEAGRGHRVACLDLLRWNLGASAPQADRAIDP